MRTLKDLSYCDAKVISSPIFYNCHYNVIYLIYKII